MSRSAAINDLGESATPGVHPGNPRSKSHFLLKGFMRVRQPKNIYTAIGRFALVASALGCVQTAAWAGSYTVTTFATGSAVGATAPDSIAYGGGSIWVEYGNGASSTDYTGKSTIVQYSTGGSVLNTYSLAGSVDGLKYNPNTGQVWALQNQDANSQLSIIDPSTKAISTFTYGSGYSSVAGSRGFDDVAFIGNSTYLSMTNPSSGSDPVVVKLNNSNPSTPVTFSTVLTGSGITATDPDSLKSTPNGGLLLTGSSDDAVTFINHPGTGSQTATSLQLTGSNLGNLDDTLYSTAASGVFYIASTNNNTVYAISASNLSPNDLYASLGTQFGIVDQSTGAVTSVFDGAGLHGALFVASPEPASVGMALLGFGILAFFVLRKRVTA